MFNIRPHILQICQDVAEAPVSSQTSGATCDKSMTTDLGEVTDPSQSNQDLPSGGGFPGTYCTVKIGCEDIPILMEDIVSREKSTSKKAKNDSTPIRRNTCLARIEKDSALLSW